MEPSVRVIVVDDEPDVADSFAMLIEQLGHEVETAHSGADALERLEDWEADLAFIDLGMPEMNGFDVADRLHEREGDTPMLVALTGYGRDQDRDRAAEHGFAEHMVKPPDLDDVIAILESLKPHSRGTRP